jgi:hypothetical protein
MHRLTTLCLLLAAQALAQVSASLVAAAAADTGAAAGQYQFPVLPVGSYQVRSRISLQEADAAIVSAATSPASNLVAERQIRGLPLNRRSYDELLTLNPGVVDFGGFPASGRPTQSRTVRARAQSPGSTRNRSSRQALLPARS